MPTLSPAGQPNATRGLPGSDGPAPAVGWPPCPSRTRSRRRASQPIVRPVLRGGPVARPRPRPGRAAARSGDHRARAGQAARLQKLDGVGPKRARRLAAAFEDALPSYDTAEVLVSCRVPARYAAAAVSSLGKSAAIRLREDPWLLLSLPQIEPGQADWFARQLLAGQAHPQDPRRGRALVGYLLTRAARDGHTAVPADVVLRSVARFGVNDPAAAVAAAVDEGSVLPFDGAEPEAPAASPRCCSPWLGTRSPRRPWPRAWPGCRPPRSRCPANAGGPQAGAAKVMPNGTDGEAIELDDGPAGRGHRRGPARGQRADRRPGHRQEPDGRGRGRPGRRPGGKSVALAAPTGRAAKRLEELRGAPATTLHRLLGAQAAAGATAGDRRPGACRSSPAARTGRSTRSWWWWTRPRCSTSSSPRAAVGPARTAPTCCSSAIRPSCPRSARAGCWPI